MQDAEAQQPEPSHGPASRGFLVAFAVCSALSLCVLWLPKYLPLTDLPQHAAQISIWKHLNDPAYGFRDVFELQYFTPYLLGYGLARLFAIPFSILVAMKLTLTLAVLGWPLSLWRLAIAARGDRWLSLLGFPVAFGYAFLWGFFSYVVALPWGILLLAWALEQARSFSWRTAWLIGAFAVLLLTAHLMVFALCGLGAAAVLGLSAQRVREALVRLAPLAPSALLAAAWAWRYRQGDAFIPTITRYGIERWVEAPALLLGYPGDFAGLLVGLLLILVFCASGVRPAPERARWLPLAIGVVAYSLAPQNFQHVSFVYPRLAVLLLPFAVVATQAAPSRVPAWLTRAALISIALGWMLGLLRDFSDFDRDARQFDVLMHEMQPNQRVRSLMFERGSDYTPGGVPFLHFPAWYQVEKGGTLSYSFASTLLSVAVFRPEKRRVADASRDFTPEALDMTKEQDDYDYYVVRSRSAPPPELFRGATRRIDRLARQGNWWLYRRGEPLPHGEPPAP